MGRGYHAAHQAGIGDSAADAAETTLMGRMTTRQEPSTAVDTHRVARPYSIEGPGDVTIEFRAAGPASRFLAVLLDLLVLGSGMLLVTTLVEALVPGLGDALLWGTLILVVSYFSIMEARTGRTLGKMALGLRVLGEDGARLTPRAALVRNILRVADCFPFGFPGVFLMVWEPHTRRLGDLVAGSVVVRDGGLYPSSTLLLRLPFRARPRTGAALDRVTLSADEYQALRTFCFRTRTVTTRRRGELAAMLMGTLHARAGIPVPNDHQAEDLLIDLVHRENGTFGLYSAGVYVEFEDGTSRS
jgi:uncharacterized RDD family membrane protein YckC